MDTDVVVSPMSVSGWMLVFPMPRSGLRENGPRSSVERPLVLGRAGPKDTGTLAFVFGVAKNHLPQGQKNMSSLARKSILTDLG